MGKSLEIPYFEWPRPVPAAGAHGHQLCPPIPARSGAHRGDGKERAFNKPAAQSRTLSSLFFNRSLSRYGTNYRHLPSPVLYFLSHSSFFKNSVASSLYICKCCWLWIKSMFTLYSGPIGKLVLIINRCYILLCCAWHTTSEGNRRKIFILNLNCRLLQTK